MAPRFINLLFILFVSQFTKAQDFSSSSLPEILTKNANAIVNYNDYSIDLVSQDKMKIHQKTSITIFNKNADYLSNLTLYYDSGERISNVYMDFFDANGKRIKKVKKRDFNDYSATGNANLYTDNRVIHYNYIALSYPYTVRYEYEMYSKYTAFIPQWMPIKSYDIGIKNSSYTFTYPLDFKIQKLESNLENFDIHKTEKVGFINYRISNIKPIKKETLSPSYYKTFPVVKLGSNKFHLAGVNGTTDNWKDFGKWMHEKLLAPRNNLSEETKAIVKEMVKDIADPIERAKIIYEYVQNKTRYISIQVEIGGWQPMMTKDVDDLGYGDCKALTFYTKSLMDVAEIPSFYTAVFAGQQKRDIEKDVVSVQGNHAFLCLPTAKDTIWLECTSQKVPFGFKNSFTDDRDVLTITPEGGKIIHTNFNKPEQNLQKTIANFSLKENGSIEGTASINSYGTQYSDHLMNFDGLAPDELDRRMKNHFSFTNNLSFSKLEVNNNKEEKRFEENITFTADNYGVKNPDGSIIFNLNALNRISHIPDRERNRQTSFEISRGFKDVDIYTTSIPETYKISDIPKLITIENQFGVYNMSVEKTSDNSLKYMRSLLINKGTYEKELYESYRTFRKKIKKLENTKIVITKL